VVFALFAVQIRVNQWLIFRLGGRYTQISLCPQWLQLFKIKIRRRPTFPQDIQAVSSAQEGLTSVFEMGTGGTPPL
jgi:hypothetical protein